MKYLNKTKNKDRFRILCFIGMLSLTVYCSKEEFVPPVINLVPVLQYEMDNSLDDESFIPDEGFGTPVMIKVQPGTGRVLILDNRNSAIYMFSRAGKYLKKIGQKRAGSRGSSQPGKLSGRFRR